jgi:hypothetical protein
LKKKYKIQHLEGSGTPILYTGCTSIFVTYVNLHIGRV